MKKTTRIFIIVLMITIILSVISIAFLPDQVRIMHSTLANTTSYLPKIWAILLAAILSIAGAAGIMISKKEEPKKYNALMISTVGIGFFCYMLIGNFIF